jgi:hypothetical protein
MSPEKPTKNAGNQKQKIMIGVIIVVLAFVAWQLFGSSGGGGSAPPPQPTAANKSAGAPMNSGMPSAQNGAAPPPEMTQPKPAVVPVNNEILKLQQQTQADYLASVNKLQMLEIQRRIDETKTAIANAELSRMTAEKSIADLITSKENSGGGDMGPIGGMPSSPFGNPPSSSPPVNTSTTVTTSIVPASAPPPSIVVQAVPQIPVVAYKALSVAYQGHKWSAVLGLDNKTMTVSVGDLLEDGSTVASISRNKVVLRRDNKNRAISVAAANF